MAEIADGPELPEVEPERLRAAVHAVLVAQSTDMPTPSDSHAIGGRLPSAARLKAGAEQSAKDEVDDIAAAVYFQSLLELGYLVASADGLAEDERVALALLVEHATESAVQKEMLQLHFNDLDATCEVLGRRERLMRVAANFETDSARHEAVSFAALVAIADGKLAAVEMGVLIELGAQFSLTAEQVRAVASDVAASIAKQLEG